LQEIVVTAVGIRREAKALGYSVQTVGGDDIARSGNVNLLNSITARAAGVSVTSSSGAAGASSFMTIRGFSSITGGNQPLFVVDGVPIDNSEIASVTQHCRCCTFKQGY
jgi:outer membrane receptor for ferrienterochelin and colicin